MQNQDTRIITKASAKVLVAGGYGVLQQKNYGLTLALQNYFYCICVQRPDNNDCKSTDVTILSPQISSSWHYQWNIQQNRLIQKDGKQNIFVYNAIYWVLQYFNKLEKAGKIVMKIIFDRGYISDADSLDLQSKYPKYKKQYRKTGLGSSACVLVSIVKCLLEIFMGTQQVSIESKYILSNIICQTANLSAQKKIGSNFDISTAIHGSHLYQNVLPKSIYQIVTNPTDAKQKMLKLAQIDPNVKKIRSIKGQFYGYIVDIVTGADTRVMVSGFLSKLRTCQQQIQTEFFEKSKQITLQLYDALAKNQREKCRQINKRHRQLQRKYSAITGVAVQPEDLTLLLDKISEIKQVIYAICPGSGGYDAIFVLASIDIFKQLQKTLNGQHKLKQVNILLDNVDQPLSQTQKQQLIKLYS